MKLTKEFQAEIEKAAKARIPGINLDGCKSTDDVVFGAEQATRIFASRGEELPNEATMLKEFDETEDPFDVSEEGMAYLQGRQEQHAQSTLQYEAQIEELKARVEELESVVEEFYNLVDSVNLAIPKLHSTAIDLFNKAELPVKETK